MDDSNVKNELNKLLIQVERELKKKMFPRKHKKLLSKSVEIVIEKLERRNKDRDLLGTYQTIKDKNKEYKFSHKIIINDFVYKDYKNGVSLKRYYRKRLKNTIAHELIHAYTYENFEFCSGDYGFHSDGSPIFLSMLTYLNIDSGHKSMIAFHHTELYKKVKSCSSYEELERYLYRLTCKYEGTFIQLEQMYEGNNVYVNSFIFSSGDITGLKGTSTDTLLFKNCIGKANIFTIGANSNIDKLKDSVLSKIRRNIFDEKYIMPECKNIEDKKNKLKLQSLDI